MIDIHSHLLPRIDDGASSMAESEEMLIQAQKAGIKTIIATPHFDKEILESGLVKDSYKLMKDVAEKYGIALLLGYEIKIQDHPSLMPQDLKGLTLNDTSYLLIELPFDRIPNYFFEYVYELQLKKYIPILAHPERCLKLIQKGSLLTDIMDAGCLLQVDAASIIGANGWKVKLFAKKIIKKRYVHIIASDAHNPEGYSKRYVKAYQKVQRWVGKQEATQLFSNFNLISD